MWRWFLFAAVLLPCSAMAQQSVLPGSRDSLANYKIPTCDELGCDRQVVEPDATLAKYGHASNAWRQRVLAHAHYQPHADDNSTCTGAVRALFALACGGKRNCEIEDEYDEKCLSPSTDQATRRRCVTVVGNYVRQCFGSGCSYTDRGIIGSSLLNEGHDEPFCSAAGFVLGSQRVPVMVTAPHCEGEVREGTWVTGVRGPVTYVHGPTDREDRGDLNPALPAYDVDDRSREPFLLKSMQPTRFAKTVFQGYNRLIASRNEVLERVSVDGEHKFSPLYCDSSPLCTVVHRDGGEIRHTCQSSKGSSGGALYQVVDGTVGVVAVNNGATRSGQVTENEGFTLLRPN